MTSDATAVIVGKRETSERAQIYCLKCEQSTWHDVVANVSSGDDSQSGWYASERHQIVRCCGCEAHSFRQTYEDASWGEDDAPLETLWPPRTRQRATLDRADHLPKRILRIYVETNLALRSGQPILTAVGIRALIESVCRHKKAKGKNLKQRIDGLVQRGIITRAQARVLHKTRFLGNKAAHETVPAEEKVLEAALQIGEHMLTSVYLLPKIANAIGRT